MKLVHALLAAMVGAPYASLTRRELSRRFDDEFDHARRDHLIEELPGAVEYVANDEGRRRRVVVEELGAVLIDEDDPDEEPERWPLEDVRRWRAAAAQVIDCLRLRQGLTGEFGVLDPECWLLGDAGRRRVVLTLAPHFELEAAAEHTRDKLTADRALVVVSPTVVVPLASAMELKKRGITFAMLTAGLDIEPPLGESDDGAAGAALSWFKYGEGFQVVTLGQRSFNLTPLQALIVRRLYQAATYDLWTVPWSELQRIAEAADFHPTRMNDVFKRVPDWEQLLESPRFGFWQLRRPPS